MPYPCILLNYSLKKKINRNIPINFDMYIEVNKLTLDEEQKMLQQLKIEQNNAMKNKSSLFYVQILTHIYNTCIWTPFSSLLRQQIHLSQVK